MRTPPEGGAPSCAHVMFTSMGDVWSFGIVMWEIASLGGAPYPGHTNYEMTKALVEEKYRMPPPHGCKTPFHQQMMECWNCVSVSVCLCLCVCVVGVTDINPGVPPAAVQYKTPVEGTNCTADEIALRGQGGSGFVRVRPTAPPR